MYSVYVHKTPDGKRYVGMTRQHPQKRWKSGHGYEHCTDFYAAIIEFGWKNISHEVVATNLSKEDAEKIERELICLYHTTNPKCGYNSYSGGLTGAKANCVTHDRMSSAQSGCSNPMYKKHHSDRTKNLIGASKRGKPLSENCKRKLSRALGGARNPAAKPVNQYDKNMNFIKSWSYIRQTKKETGANNIYACCVGKLKTSGGYVWRYAEVGGA